MTDRPTVLLVAALALSSPLHAQRTFTHEVFIGVSTVNAEITVDWDERISRTTESQFYSEMDRAFTLGLRRAGVKVDVTPPNFLSCDINVLYDDGLVAYALGVEYMELVGGRLVITWRRSWIGTVGERNLDGADYAQNCVEEFESDWLQANPRR